MASIPVRMKRVLVVDDEENIRHLLLVVLMPLAVLALAVWTLDRWRGRSRRLPRRLVVVGGWALLGAAGLFMLLRNTPAAPWLAP